MPNVSPLVGAPDVQDLGLGSLHLDLQRRDERILGVYDRVIRAPVHFHANRKLHPDPSHFRWQAALNSDADRAATLCSRTSTQQRPRVPHPPHFIVRPSALIEFTLRDTSTRRSCDARLAAPIA